MSDIFEKGHCDKCGRDVNVNRFHLSRSLANALIKIHRSKGYEAFNTKTLLAQGIIDSNDYTNLAQLKYLGVIEKCSRQNDPGARLWRITDLGKTLLSGGKIHAWVNVFNDKIIATSNELVDLKSAVGYYQPPQDWARDAKKIEAINREQETLFKI